MNNAPSFGLMAEFEDSDTLMDAIHRLRSDGYTKMDGYTPYPVHGMAEALGFRRTWIPELVLAGGIIGGLTGFFLQYITSVYAYPLNIGGRPLNSWVSFVPVTFELTILLASLSAIVGMIALNGLPQPYHPVFNVPSFARASRDRFFLVVESKDPKFDYDNTRQLLESLGAHEVTDVPH